MPGERDVTNDTATSDSARIPYDAILLVSFGGPEGPDDVLPFLENVLRGRNVPRERMLEVAHHYDLFGGVSPINEQIRALIAAVRAELKARGPDLPIYWGNRNWRPFLVDALREMRADGRKHALAFITSAYSSYSSCRQYLEDIARAQAELGADAPRVSPLRKFFDHPGFIQANADRLRDALDTLPPAEREQTPVIFTAHSIPESMARVSDYEAQLREACRLVADQVGAREWELAYQSRSGSPAQPWLGPDIGERLRAQESRTAVVAPIGFISDHMEVLYDLDVEARELAESLGITMVRAGTAGVHPAFVRMVRELVAERMPDRPGDGVCPPGCCPRAEARQVVTS
jgi:protoporphyrin/coproporphyrin ferrochelatase